jgi:hypothetical protein
MLRRLLITMACLGAALPLAGSTLTAAGGQRVQETLPATIGDLGAAQLIEVRDNAGQVLLHGTWTTSKNTPKEMERKAELASPTGQASKGNAAIEIERKDGVATKDEIEIEIEKVPAMTSCSVFIDGQAVAAVTTSKKGKAEVKLSRKIAATR